MPSSSRVIALAAAMTLAGATAYSQHVISAKAGLLHYTEGEVLLEGQPVTVKAGEYPEMKEGQVLRTTEVGRAEVLLTPGAFMRVAENSSFKLLVSKLENVRLEILSGSVLIETIEVTEGSAIALQLGQATVELEKRGVFRIDAEPRRVRVYDGQAVVLSKGQTLTLKEGKMATLDVLVSEKFDKSTGDSFHRWAGRRSGYVARANMVSARLVRGETFNSGSWYFNPYFGTYTYLPLNGYSNIYGYRYLSPRVYIQPSFPTDAFAGGSSAGMAGPSYDSRRGNAASTYSGSMGGGMSAPAPSSAPAAPAAAPRSADSGASRSSGSGR